MGLHDAVLGVDGCPGGWVGALVTPAGVSWYAGSLTDLLALPAAVVAVDIPLALPPAGVRRACELAAKERLGAQRSSVFFAPPLPVLEARSHTEASAMSRAAGSVGVSLQTWHIVPKIAEAVLLDDPRLLEVHPELSFRALGAVTASKKTAAGRAERLALLRSWVPVELPSPRRGRAAADDCLDALACAWTAARWLRGDAEVLGEELLGGRLSRIVV
jgi:predicted RNase H-like nuclease